MREKKRPEPEAGPSQKIPVAGTAESYAKKRGPSRRKRPRPGSGRDIILGVLESAGGDWVPGNYLMRVGKSMAVHSQIAELRKTYGLVIKNKQERAIDGVRLSYYRLVEGGKE